MNKKTSLTFVLTVIFFLTGAVWADDSSGGRKDASLTIVSSTISQGEENVETGREIKFSFSKNISNPAVVDNNLKCFYMIDSAGNSVPVEVVAFTDHPEMERRNDLFIKTPVLNEAEKYMIVIGPKLTGENGSALGKELAYTFSTPGWVTKNDNNLKYIIMGAAAVIFLVTVIAAMIKNKKA